MKILMIGLGSIGQRHLRNIRRLLGENAEITAYRVRRLKTTFSDNMQIKEAVDLEEEYNIKVFTDLNEAIADGPDIVFVSNVTNAHIPCALAAVRAGCDVFLEKPISDSMDGVDELKKAAEENKVKVFVGFQNRYNPALRMAKQLLDEKKLGDIAAVHSEVGERLTTMHSYEDYKTTYMARKDLGGGIILNQMVHEIDYLRFLFGELRFESAFVSTGEKTLGIDVDDRCSMLLRAGDVPVSVNGDFYQYPPSRYVKIIGTRGVMCADIIKNRLTVCVDDEVTVHEFEGFERNDMFISELRSFLECIENDTEPEISLNDGIESLRIALSAKDTVSCK